MTQTAHRKKRWFPHPLQNASLQQKMTTMLLVIVLQSLVVSGMLVVSGTVYLRGFNGIMTDVYNINQLLSTHTQESSDYRDYVLNRSESSYASYLAARARSTRALGAISIPFERSREQFLLLQAISASYETYRAACDETVLKRVAGGDYALPYDRSLRIGEYIDGYIKALLRQSVDQGQTLYQQNLARFRTIPLLFAASIVLSLLGIGWWTRWMLRRVVSPINDLIRVTGAMSENQYDAPDLMVYEEDEISQLALVVNEMKHSTAQLVESLRTQQEIESQLHTQEIQRVKMESMMDTLRLSLLQSQINPHFLFNTLNIISRMAQLENAPKTEDLIVRLASLFRYNLQSANDIVPLDNELRIVEDYIAIQQIRFGSRIDFDLQCTVNPAPYTVPVFTMQPLIENAVIHGISPMEAGGRVVVAIARRGPMLRIRVADSGVGMTAEQVRQLLEGNTQRSTHVSGIGVSNVRERIMAHYPGSRFAIESEPGAGTAILIEIPMDTEEAPHVQNTDR